MLGSFIISRKLTGIRKYPVTFIKNAKILVTNKFSTDDSTLNALSFFLSMITELTFLVQTHRNFLLWHRKYKYEN